MNRKTKREKLAAARDIFTELHMPLERDRVWAEHSKSALLRVSRFENPFPGISRFEAF